MTTEQPEDVPAAFRRGREAVDEFTGFWLGEGEMWREESATDVLCWRAAPHVRPVTFNRHQEGQIGADWLWWFVDSESNTAFGMLCQAKNLKRDGRRWAVGYHQTNKSNGPQLPALLESSRLLDVPAAYVLYCGPPHYRKDLDCGPGHTQQQCPRCARAGVSVLSALAAQSLLAVDAAGAGTASFRLATPLEDLTVEGHVAPLLDPRFRKCPPPLQRFLATPQYGSAEVAKQITAQLLELSRGQLFQDDARLERMPRGSLFPEVPRLSGHYTEPYLRHVLRGLRTEVPDYVRDAMDGRPLPPEVTGAASGMRVTRLRRLPRDE